MMKIKLYPHQVQALEKTKDFNKVAYYLDMGLGYILYPKDFKSFKKDIKELSRG